MFGRVSVTKQISPTPPFTTIVGKKYYGSQWGVVNMVVNYKYRYTAEQNIYRFGTS